jgi:hypothetical protein
MRCRTWVVDCSNDLVDYRESGDLMDGTLNEPCSGKLQFKILAPCSTDVPAGKTDAGISTESHSDVLFDLQMLRGQVYREYTGIAATLLPDGRHWHPLDEQSWHVVLQDQRGIVVGCARYRPILGGFEQLICSKAAVALSPVTGPVFRSAFAHQVADARRRGIHYGEASAWALSESARCSTAAVNIALMSFALAEWLGGGVGLTTASTRHHASLILRRLGGRPLAGFPPYYEPMFDCSIELLHFDINQIEARYAAKLDEMRAELRRTPVLCPVELPNHRPYPVSVPAANYILPANPYDVVAALPLQ